MSANKYSSASLHLLAIEDRLMKLCNIPDHMWPHVKEAIQEAFKVGHSTTTTDDWCDD